MSGTEPGSAVAESQPQADVASTFAQLAHDIRAPLSSVIGALDVLRLMDAKLSPERKAQLISSALNEARRLDRFMTQVLEIGKLEAGAAPDAIAPVNIREMVADCLSAAQRPNTSDPMVKVVMDRQLTVNSDPSLVRRIVGVLIENAFIHGGSHPEVSIEAHARQSGVRLTVQDNGPGIEPDHYNAIFAKFGPEASTAKASKLGLGLAFARLAARRLGGDLSVSAPTDGGAVFELRLKDLDGAFSVDNEKA